MQHKKELSLREYMERFSSEEKCAEYLIEKKWPQGFRCPKCGSKNAYYIKTRKKYQCKECKHQTSITAHTIMHRSHLPLMTWFTAIYFVARDKRGISAVSLAGKVDVCYETAWYMLVRIRKAMDMKEHEYMLEGTMEMDDSYFGAIKTQNGAAMSIGRISTFLDIYIQRDLDNGTLTEVEAQEIKALWLRSQKIPKGNRYI